MFMDEIPTRKKLRLPEYDYTQPGAYFITVCTQNRIEHFGKVSPSKTFKTAFIELNKTGLIVEEELNILATCYPSVNVGSYVIMPNHVHFILRILSDNSPAVSEIIRLWKRAVTKKIGMPLWQKSFHDHVIRDDEDYERLLKYIENNPAQWELDSLNPENN